MSYRSSFSQHYGGGRASPYAPRLSQQDRSFSDLFEYVADVPDAQQYAAAIPVEDDDAPDVLHVKYMGQAFKLNFPAYSISESGVTVGEVRRRVAEGLKEDPRRVRLVYKDRELKYDPTAIKKYGCKQNSELAVVVTVSLGDYGGSENHQSSGEDSGSASSMKPPSERRRPRGLSSVRHRSDENRYTGNTSSSSSSFLHPNGYSRQEPYVDKRRSLSPGRQKEPYRTSNERTSEKTSEPARATPSPAPKPKRVAADPTSPLGKVQALQDVFYDKWLPESQTFLDAPPSDAAQKDREYRRLSESVMRHVIEAADAIELQGDQEARAERKRVLGEAQDLLRKLDAVPKK